MADYGLAEFDIIDESEDPTDEELRRFEADMGDLCQIDLSAPAGVSIDDPVQMYLKEIEKVPPLKAEEEEALIRRMGDGDAEAKSRMTEAYLPLVVSIARRYVDQGVFLQDLIQEGTLGLMQAVDSFDAQRGFKFSTYAAWWIRQAITRTIKEQAETVRISDHLVQEANKLTEVSRQLTQDFGRAPTVEELAERMGMSVDEVLELQKISENAESLTAPEEKEENDQPEKDTKPAEKETASVETAEQKELRDQLNAAMSSLTETEQQVLRMRYGLDDGRNRSQEEVGEALGLDEDMVGQIEADAMEKMQQADAGSGLLGYVDED